jgi:hypothetical protein
MFLNVHLYNLAFRTTAVGAQRMWRETEESSMLFNDAVSCQDYIASVVDEWNMSTEH